MTLVATQLFGAKLRERRRYPRVELALPGRYMLSDHHEYPCSTINVSLGGIVVVGRERGFIGEHVVAYFNHIGRIEGMIARNFDSGFAVALQLRSPKSERLTQVIDWLVSHHTRGVPDDRVHERIEPFRRRAMLTTPDGREYRATLTDLSVFGAALTTDAAPPIGSSVTIGRTSARVVRHFATGIAVKFEDQLPADAFGVDPKL